MAKVIYTKDNGKVVEFQQVEKKKDKQIMG